MRKLRRTYLLLILCSMGCTSDFVSDDDLILEGTAIPISIEEISGSDEKLDKAQRTNNPKDQKKIDHTSKSPASDAEEAAERNKCIDLMERSGFKLKSLSAVLDARKSYEKSNLAAFLAQLHPSQCNDLMQRNSFFINFSQLIRHHQGKIGLVLPLTGSRHELANWIVEGLRVSFSEAGLEFEKNVILRDSAGSPAISEQEIADLFLKDRVSMLVGGLDDSTGQIILKIAKEFLIPSILISRERNLTASSSYLFRVYPDEKRLAETLVEGAKARGWQRIAILKPSGNKSTSIVKYFASVLNESGGTISTEIVYTPGNFESMSAATRELFRTDESQRREEYRQAYQDARKRADEEGVRFDPRMVLLPPVINFDAVFIPDDFRIARHFAKLFRFQKAQKIGLIGNHEWRSPGLLQPFDDMFQGAIFADFIESYEKIPTALQTGTWGSPYFIHPQNVVPTDFRLIGYHLGKVFLEVSKLRGKTRQQLANAMGKVEIQVEGKNKALFDSEHQVYWPTFLFSVHKEGLVPSLEPDKPSGSVISPSVAKGLTGSPADVR